MQIRIETNVSPLALRALLDERKLVVPVFFDKNTNLVITINPRNRAHAIELIDWLMTR